MVLSADSNEPHPVLLVSEYETILGTDWTKSFLQLRILTFSFQKYNSLIVLSESDNSWSQETRDSIVLYRRISQHKTLVYNGESQTFNPCYS